ncbi:MAG: metal dependent phosphohydrolase [Edafosvirus sp.]|uniref:Metal dependent phosphohydrolase n=1 Tax=Edafosvirus sp. TaxID=2487765 RepID=A0A3G4ZTD9_9VIRU|nr:MAG: metal dependent phosphohydrolase [Edafosvirus sp.]
MENYDGDMELYNTVCEFVIKECDGRDESHGFNHMKTVAMIAIDILEQEIDRMQITDNEKINKYIEMVIIVALLHDVADHKYDKDGKIKKNIINFLNKTVPDDAELITDIIDRISYSKENKAIKNNEKLDWEEKLGQDGLFIRNIVSDADKLEAIGKKGIDRCVEYTKVIDGNNLSEIEINKKVVEHAKEKLLRLKDEFIRTPSGKEMAEPLHNEMILELNNLIL